MRAAVWLCQPLLLCSLLTGAAACGSAWSGGVRRLVWDLLSAQDASHLVLVHDRSPVADALWPSCSTWSSELRRMGVYQTVLSTSAPLERLDRTVTSHQGQTMVLLAADTDTSLDFIVRLNGSHRLDESFQLLVLVNGTDYRAALADWYLPINNQLVLVELWPGSDGSLDRADLLETYRLSVSHPVRWLRLGRWSASASLWDWTGESLYDRRGDWSGLTLRVATNQDPPLISFEPGPPDDVGGYVGTAWKILADILRFNYTTRLSVDGQWGSQLGNGSWNGVIGMLERQEVDVGVTTLISTAPRRRVISFTRGLLTLRYRVFVRQSSTLEYSWTTYVAVFSPPLWAALVGCVLLGGAAMALLCRLEQRHLPHLAAPHGGTHWRDAALFCIAALSQQELSISYPYR
ncbi:uncharacterized protein LOC122386085 [Amphibalanus amphitrite]|uniref:uncharacterized protein LOC122386085 n=1 Tax=Amphibalanus amphitrite TaxID=1232801 RepID=UPI001C9253BB|nr:uncharacterized protein LOC122386085 [Amphibalanus amphitrite]